MKKCRLRILTVMLMVAAILSGCAGKSAPSASAPAPSPEPAITPPTLTPSGTPGEAASISKNEAFSAVYQFKAEHAAEFICAGYLLRDRDELFAEYDGVSEHMQLNVGQNRDWRYSGDEPAITDTVYYWHDAEGTASPGRAASELIGDMLEDLKDRTSEYSFTVTSYQVPESQDDLRDWQDLLWEDVDEIWNPSISRTGFEDELARLLPLQLDDGEYGFRAETLSLPLVNDMWVVIPQFSFAYSGVYRLRQFSEIPAAQLTEEGLMPYQYDDGYASLYYILLKHGDVWQMQNYRLIKQRCGGSGEKTIDLSGLDICRAEVRLDTGAYNNYTDKEVIARIIACLDGKSIAWEREYRANGDCTWVKFYTSDAPDARYAYKVVLYGPDSISIDDRQSEHGYTFAPADVRELERLLESLCA